MKYPDKQRVNNLPVQTIEDGYGPIYERQYCVPLPVDMETAQLVFDELKANLEKFLPNVVATVDDTHGAMRVEEGNRYVVHLLGPWDAPLEVDRVETSFFEFVTLKSAPEAGRLRFMIEHGANTQNRFIISSRARSGLYIFHILYHYLGLAKFGQRKMWEKVCINFHNRCEEVLRSRGEFVLPEETPPVFSETRVE